MNFVAKFEKVSFEQYFKDFQKIDANRSEEEVRKIYDAILLPKRATQGSAGYDFFLPYAIDLNPNEEILIPTGIRVKMESNYVLMLFPRSSLGFKYRLQLNNTVGIIDSDYYGAKNEGHIFARLLNDSRTNRQLHLDQGEGVMQGILVPFGICVDDATTEERVGGIGSTNRKSGCSNDQ